MNKVVVTGRLSQDPVLRSVAGDKQICDFTVCAHRKKVNGVELKPDFVPCRAWGKVGESINKWFKTGSMISICGRVASNNYTNKEGVKIYEAFVYVDEWEFVESRESQRAYKELHEAKNAETAPAEESTPAVKEDPKPKVETPAKAESKTESSAETISYGDEFMNIPSDADDFVPFT